MIPRYYRAIRLFASIVWRPCPRGEGRLSWRTAWEVARIVEGLK